MRADIHDGPEHMLQSDTEYIDARPYQPASTKSLLHRAAGPYIWVIRDRASQSCPGSDVCFAPLATEVARRCNMSRRAIFGLMHCSKRASYSITSWARARSPAGSSSPSALAA